MYAFIDESGHTGGNLEDKLQPTLYYLAMASKYNIGLLSKSKVENICKKLQVERLHASELGMRNEDAADDILRLIKKFNPRFIIAEVEKSYLAVVKIFDCIFDSGENLGARNHIYSFRALRLLLLFNFAKIVEKEVAFEFYNNCLMAKTQKQANETLIDISNKLICNLGSMFDERTNELIYDALTYAKNNPEKITTFNAGKERRWMHLPNVVAFTPTLQFLAEIAKMKKTRINKIVHDEQIQLKRILNEAHEFSSNKNFPDEIKFLDNPAMRVKELKNSIFELANSKNNTGLQIVDFILYNWSKREYLINNDNPNSLKLLDYYSNRAKFFIFSYKQLEHECFKIIENIEKMPLTEEQLKQGVEMVNKMEDKFQSRLK